MLTPDRMKPIFIYINPSTYIKLGFEVEDIPNAVHEILMYSLDVTINVILCQHHNLTILLCSGRIHRMLRSLQSLWIHFKKFSFNDRKTAYDTTVLHHMLVYAWNFHLATFHGRQCYCSTLSHFTATVVTRAQLIWFMVTRLSQIYPILWQLQ